MAPTDPKNNTGYDHFAETFAQSREGMHWDEIDELIRYARSDIIPNPISSINSSEELKQVFRGQTVGAGGIQIERGNQSLASFCPLNAFGTFGSKSTKEILSNGNGVTTQEVWSILDVGCGTGRLLEHLQGLSGAIQSQRISYAGLDLSEKLLAKTSQHDLSHFHETHFALGDMRNMGEIYGGRVFDTIFFIASFHHLESYEDRLSVLMQAKSMIHDHGKILMTNWHLLSPMNQTRYASSLVQTYPDDSADFMIKIGQYTRFYHAFSEHELRRLCQEADLRIDHISFGDRNSLLCLR